MKSSQKKIPFTLVSWEDKEANFFSSLFETIKNSFRFSESFSQELLVKGSIKNALAYASFIFFISHSFLVLTYTLILFEEVYAVFQFFTKDLGPISDDYVRIFLLIFPFLQMIYFLIENIFFSFFLYLSLSLLDDKNSKENSLYLSFKNIFILVFYSKGSYLLISLPGFLFKLLGILISIYLLYRFFIYILSYRYRFKIQFSIILSYLTSLIFMNFFQEILKFLLKKLVF